MNGSNSCVLVRQLRYRVVETLTLPLGERRPSSTSKNAQDVEDAQTILAHLEDRTSKSRYVSIGELRDVLRRAAALLCRTQTDQSSIAHYLVGIPFAIFSKQSMKLGVSLWLGVINENPRVQSRILAEIAGNWEMTVRRRLGIFSQNFRLVTMTSVERFF